MNKINLDALIDWLRKLRRSLPADSHTNITDITVSMDKEVVSIKLSTK